MRIDRLWSKSTEGVLSQRRIAWCMNGTVVRLGITEEVSAETATSFCGSIATPALTADFAFATPADIIVYNSLFFS